jgi:hypothetical protein
MVRRGSFGLTLFGVTWGTGELHPHWVSSIQAYLTPASDRILAGVLSGAVGATLSRLGGVTAIGDVAGCLPLLGR